MQPVQDYAPKEHLLGGSKQTVSERSPPIQLMGRGPVWSELLHEGSGVRLLAVYAIGRTNHLLTCTDAYVSP